MERKMKLWIVMATWLCWSIICGLARVSPLSGNSSYALLTYSTSYFYTQDVSTGSYQSFISSLRKDLASKAESYDIPILRTKSQATNDNEFVYVSLSNSAVTIRLALKALDAYVIGYEVDSRSYFFEEAPSGSQNKLFNQNNKKTNVELSTNYAKLGDRSKIQLGFDQLNQALYTLKSFDSSKPTDALRSTLVVVIQMVAEAARFKLIERKLALEHLVEGFTPQGDVISYENSWKDISDAFQGSTNGVISIELQNPDYTKRKVTNVAEIKDDLALLLAKSSSVNLEQATVGLIEELLPTTVL